MLTPLPIGLKARVAHPTPSILNRHHTQWQRKRRSDGMNGDRIMQGESGRKCVWMTCHGVLRQAVEGGRNCALIVLPTMEKRLEDSSGCRDTRAQRGW